MKINVINLAIGLVVFGILFGVYSIIFDLIENVYFWYTRYLTLSYILLKNIERRQIRLIEENS